MHICLIAANDGLADPRARVTRHVLERAGHRVSVVTAGPTRSDAYAIGIQRPSPTLGSRLARRLGIKPGPSIEWLTPALTEAAASTNAEVYLPTHVRSVDAAVAAARQTDGVVFRTPKMPDLGDLDLINLAPAHPDLAAPPAGVGVNHTPSDHRPPYVPEPNRHSERRVVLCYRRSEINPGRYLEAALRRAGVELRVETGGIDLSSVDPSTDVVIFVEGPYPALDVTGATDVPTLFWAHHGEHHLHANVRLTDRYRADAVLLAHSWHLAFWFPTKVHRFPFGMDPSLLRPDRPLRARTHDVAMVGAGLRGGGQYGRRQALVQALESSLPPDRLGFKEAVSADEMAELYGDSRIVINEGGTRHFPITMRVMETIGSGAVLLSDPLPGMDMLLRRDSQYRLLGDDVTTDVARILDDLDAAQRTVDSALETARGRHTYDHRVDELLAIASNTEKRDIAPARDLSPLAGVIDRDVQTQRVGQLNAPELADELPSREVWDLTELSPSRLGPNKMETVALRADDAGDLVPLLRSARRFIYVDGTANLDDYLNRERPESVVGTFDGITRVDTMAPSYRIMDFEDTSA